MNFASIYLFLGMACVALCPNLAHAQAPAQGGATAAPQLKPKAMGDSFNLNHPELEPAIPESDPLIGGVCTADAIDFDPCAKAWFSPPNALKPTGLTPKEIQERDRMFSLAALAVVKEDWQPTP